MKSTIPLLEKKKKNQLTKKPLTSHRSQENRQAKPKFGERFHRDPGHNHGSVYRLWSRS